METKICSICGLDKSKLDFNIFYNTKKHKSYCKICDNEKRKIKDSKYIANNKEKIKERRKIYINSNKEKIRIKEKEYRSNNKEKIRIKNNNWRNKIKNEPFYKLKFNISKGISKSIKRNGFKKQSKTNEILGCTYEEFKLYLESKFQPWMTWDNYGNPEDGILEPNKTWDIDHIIPLSTATCEEDIIRLNHYNNLQPLCSYINRIIKKDNI